MALIVLGLFILQFPLAYSALVPNLAEVSLLAVGLASLMALVSLIGLIPKGNKINPFWPTIIYFLFNCLALSLIFGTSEINLNWLPLLSLVAIFAVLFNLAGVILAIISTLAIFTVYLVTEPFLEEQFLVLLFILGPLSLMASFIIWYNGKTTLQPRTPATDPAIPLANAKINEFTNDTSVIINSIGDGVVVIDRLGVIKAINPKAEQLTGWNKQDSVGLNYKTILQLTTDTGQPVSQNDDPILSVIKNKQEIRSDKFNLLTRHKKNLLLSLVVSPIAEENFGIIVIFRDITEEKRHEREQSEFISTASHEMRTPIASIEGYLGLAINHQTATIDARARDYITKAQQSAQHLGELFQNLLDIARADEGHIATTPVVIDVLPFLQKILDNFRPKATEKQIKLRLGSLESPHRAKIIIPKILLYLDQSHFREIIDNLVDNAIKYNKPGGEVVVDVKTEAEHATIVIKDTGMGIANEDLSHLFQKFYRVNNQDTNEISGTGLGLYLTRRLVEILGGQIWVESVLGDGTTFFVRFPKISEQKAHQFLSQPVPLKNLAPRPVQSIDIIKPQPKPISLEQKQSPGIAPSTQPATPVYRSRESQQLHIPQRKL